MKKIIPYILVTVVSAIIFGYWQYNKPHRDIAKEKASFELTADELFNAFEENEDIANAMYLDKVISVTGKIVDLENNQDGKSVLTLEAENAMIGGVRCTMKDSGVALVKDMEATFKCRCTGFLADVILIECSVE